MNLKEAVRDILGVREVYGTDEWPTFCFSPDHDNKNTPSASVNVRKGLWVCYSCGRGGSVSALLTGVPISDPSTSQYLGDVEDLLRHVDEVDHEYYKCLPEAWLSLFAGEPHPAWYERGVSRSAIEHFSLGYDHETDCLTYPLRDLHGRVLGVVRRRLDGGKPKYKYPAGIDIHDLLFRYHEAPCGEPIVVVEGALDAIALYDAGIFAVAIYGGHMSPTQEELIRRLYPSEVVLAFDNDEAGEDLTRSVLETDMCLVASMRKVSWVGIDAKDVAELSVQGRRKLISQAVDILV